MFVTEVLRLSKVKRYEFSLTHGCRFRVGRSKFLSISNSKFELLVPRVMGAKLPLGNTSGGYLHNIFQLIIGWVRAVHVAW